MKEKSVMADNFFDFSAVKEALSELSTDILELESALKIKQVDLQASRDSSDKLLEEKQKRIDNLTQVTQGALSKIENITAYIEGIL